MSEMPKFIAMEGAFYWPAFHIGLIVTGRLLACVLIDSVDPGISGRHGEVGEGLRLVI